MYFKKKKINCIFLKMLQKGTVLLHKKLENKIIFWNKNFFKEMNSITY